MRFILLMLYLFFLEMLEVDYVNSTRIIAQQPKMTAINSCIEVDLTGQIVSDSIGTRMYSGFGGQVDFIRGAAEGFDGKGKPIIAFPSSAKGISKIAPTIKTGLYLFYNNYYVFNKAAKLGPFLHLTPELKWTFLL